MLEQYFRYPKVLRRLRGGGLGDELDRIATYLVDNGYQRASAKIYLGRLARFSGFMSGAARGRPITKFRKDRLVPVHPSTLAALRNCARRRDATFPVPETPGFFISSRGTRLSPAGLNAAFNAATTLAGFDGGGKRLRPHDLRHRFAVKRLATWHEERADVRALLPLLATYLGHARYSDTAYYVTAGADLLAMAAKRLLAPGEPA